MIHELIAYLHVKNATKAIEFYTQVFGAEEVFRLSAPDGMVAHAHLKLDGHVLLISDEHPDWGIHGPAHLGGTSVSLHLHVDDADDVIARAAKAGATVTRECADQFYGERGGRIRDPFGHEWIIGHQIEEVSFEEMQRRFTAMFTDA